MNRVPDEAITRLFYRLEEQAGGPTKADAPKIIARVAHDLGVTVERVCSVMLDDLTMWGAG